MSVIINRPFRIFVRCPCGLLTPLQVGLLVSPAIWGTGVRAPWSLRTYTNLAIFSFSIYSIYVEIYVILPDFVDMQAVLLLAHNPGDTTDYGGLITSFMMMMMMMKEALSDVS